MSSLKGFNANEVPPQTFDIIPNGKYVAAIVESEKKATNDGTGEYLKLKFQILEGQHKGRLLWHNLNLENSNKQTVEIAKSQLSSICRAVNVMCPNDSIELHNIPLLITVKSKKREDTGDLQNEIRGFAKNEGTPAAQSTATSATPAPWKR